MKALAKRWSLTFTPWSAFVNWTDEPQVSADGPEPNTLAISKEVLARYPGPIPRAASGITKTNGSREGSEEPARACGTSQSAKLDGL